MATVHHAGRGHRHADPANALPHHGLLSMLGARLETQEQRQATWAAAGMLGVALLGFIGVSGAHLGLDWREDVLVGMPGQVLHGAATGALALAAVFLWRRDRSLSNLAAMLCAYLLGNLLSGVLHRQIDLDALFDGATAVRFVASRLLYALGVSTPMLMIYLLLVRDRSRFHFGIGDLHVRTRLGRRDDRRSWAWLLGLFLLGVAMPLFVFMQASVGFGPLLSGRLPALALPLLLMAFANAFAEELLFRGLLQGAAIAALGMARGIWAIGLLFGLHHWGASFDPIASLPGALAVGAGSVLFGKSVVETRGLGWAIAAHVFVNLAVFSAYYVKG